MNINIKVKITEPEITAGGQWFSDQVFLTKIINADRNDKKL